MSHNLLAALFDRHKQPIVVVSSYDSTLTYINVPAATWRVLPKQEPIGDLARLPFDVALTYWGLEWAQAPVARSLHAPHLMQYNRNPDVEEFEEWWISSAVPSADNISPEVLGSAHAKVALKQAMAEHEVLLERTAIAMEYTRCQRLQTAALAAITDASRRLDWVGSLLMDQGARPINPRDGDSAPMH